MKTQFISLSIMLSMLISIGCIAQEPKIDLKKAKIQQNHAVQANNEFALRLYDKLNTSKEFKSNSGNLFYGPYSITTALAMTYNGAAGNTKTEMARALNFILDDTELNQALAAIAKSMADNNKAKTYELDIANALWLNNKESFLKDFINTNQKYYDTAIKKLDFYAKAEESAAAINKWCADNTNDKIKKIVEADNVRQAALVLTNAIYFKGKWAIPFDPKKTHEQDFYINPETKVKTPLMYQKESFLFYSDATAQLIELPYKGDNIVMNLIMPTDRQVDISAIEKSLTAAKLDEYFKKMKIQKVRVSIPKFTMNFQAGLIETFKSMGMKDAFTSKADFSGINGHNNLLISDILHKSFVEVNEEGTEAAAVTAVVMTKSAMPRMPSFVADRPFIFIIRDKGTGSILFIGKLSDPSKLK
ncbi:MAG: serpin family protein [Phycisphaerae bacterium]|nr:serpin family protein [Phycisphaerae bacterium]